MPGTKKSSPSFDGWKVVVQTFVADTLNHIRGDFREHVHAWIRHFRDRFIGLLCVTIGSIFIEISLALLFNTVFSSSWAGYGVIGVFILALGVIINSRQ